MRHAKQPMSDETLAEYVREEQEFQCFVSAEQLLDEMLRRGFETDAGSFARLAAVCDTVNEAYWNARR